MRHFLILFLCFQFGLAFGQNEWWKKDNDTTTVRQVEDATTTEPQPTKIDEPISTNIVPGNITVKQNPLVNKIIEFKSATIPPYMAPVMEGYRIQLFFDQNRKEVDKARIKAQQYNNKIPTYIEYKVPNYNLLLGDYRSALEAEKIRAELLNEFPEAIITKTKIYFPVIEE